MNPAHSGMITTDLVKTFIWFLIKKVTIRVGLWLRPGFFSLLCGEPRHILAGSYVQYIMTLQWYKHMGYEQQRKVHDGAEPCSRGQYPGN